MDNKKIEDNEIITNEEENLSVEDINEEEDVVGLRVKSRVKAGPFHDAC